VRFTKFYEFSAIGLLKIELLKMKEKIILILTFLIMINAIELPPKPNMRMIEINKKRVWMTEKQVETLIETDKKFIDVTETQDLENPTKIHNFQFPDKPSQQDIMKGLLPKVSQQILFDKINHLSEHFPSRHCNRPEGIESTNWIKKQYDDIINNLSPERKQYFSTSFLPTPNRNQSSIIVTFKGSDSTDLVILGAHEGFLIII
jgi:hypothetical protein